jgi:hypothetical protein
MSGCSCHIHPPCSYCTESYECNNCGRICHPDDKGLGPLCNVCLEKDQDLDLMIDTNGDFVSPSLEEMRKRILKGYVPTHQNFSVSGEVVCKHEWVTWTGLHGTITDCTKCKAQQKDARVEITIKYGGRND